MNILDNIQSRLPSLSKAERKVAEVILAAPQEAIRLSIGLLAQRADVSEPTVNRFCRHMDTDGFPDFKLRLAQNLAQGTPWVSRNIDASDTIAICADKIFQSAIAGLNRVHQGLDISALHQAVSLLSSARKIAFFGQGASAAVAHDAMNKFFRFPVPVIYSDDDVVQRMHCINCTGSDVVVLISHTGRTKNVVQLARLARENGASVLAITSEDSPLSQEATLSLLLDVAEDTDMYMPMLSRLAQLTVIDLLVTGYTLSQGETCRQHLQRVKETLKASRFDR